MARSLLVFGLSGLPFAVAAEGSWEAGRCTTSGQMYYGKNYMNLASYDMDETDCRREAWRIKQQDWLRISRECNYVSYSSSMWPQMRGNFCQCFAGCKDLAQPESETWRTYEVEPVILDDTESEMEFQTKVKRLV